MELAAFKLVQWGTESCESSDSAEGIPAEVKGWDSMIPMSFLTWEWMRDLYTIICVMSLLNWLTWGRK